MILRHVYPVPIINDISALGGEYDYVSSNFLRLLIATMMQWSTSC